MTTTRLSLNTAAGFNFRRTVFSHGWCSLPPFSHDPERGTLGRTLALRSGRIVRCMIEDGTARVYCRVSSAGSLDAADRSDITAQMTTCLRLDEDLTLFYRHASKFPEYRWIARAGAGRILRAPTVFEDAVKTLCTTNCTWALTTLMVGNLVQVAGRASPDGCVTFPTPDAVAALTEKELRQSCTTGYRAPYLLEFATHVAAGNVNVEAWRTFGGSTEALEQEIRQVKGMGPYAAGNLLRLLGRHDSLALDSWVRGRFFQLHKRGRKVKDAVIERHYEQYGSWRGLLFWLEMTRDWHDKKFPAL